MYTLAISVIKDSLKYLEIQTQYLEIQTEIQNKLSHIVFRVGFLRKYPCNMI